MSRKILQYSSIGNMVDGTNYCSGVETLAENLMEDNEDDAAIVFPSKDGWAALRSSEYAMTTDNAEAIVPQPIYKINKLFVKVPKDLCFKTEYGDYYLKDLYYKNGSNPLVFDISPYLVAAEEWKALGISTTYWNGIYKDNTFFWEIGNNTIPFISNVYKISPTLWDKLFGSYENNVPTYGRLLQSVLIASLDMENPNLGHAPNGLNDVPLEFLTKRGMEMIKDNLTHVYGLKNTDVRDWLFRIEYVPMTSKTKIRARKNAPTAVDYIQPFNQRAEINAVSALGKNMYLTAQKTGVREIKIVKNYTRLADIPPLGALVRHNGKRYRLIANTYNQTNTIFVQVTHTLSENWTSRSKHIAVDQKYRNWKVPQDTLWRNLYWEDYVLISPELNVDVMYQEKTAKASMALSHIMQGLKIDHTDDATVDTMFFIKGDNDLLGDIRYHDKLYGVCTPCSTMVVGNSIVFAGEMKDNLSAGLRRASDVNLCEEVLYCNENGTLEKMCVILSDGVKNGAFNAESGETDDIDPTLINEWDTSNGLTSDGRTIIETAEEDARNIYPEVLATGYSTSTNASYNYTVDCVVNAPAKVLMHNDFYVDKDPGEALKFTYQIHFVSDGDIIVGSKLAEHNPLIKHWEKNRRFRLWGLKVPIGEGADVFIPRDDEPSWEKLSDDADGNTFTVADRTQDLDGKEVFELTINNELTDCVGWCITDEKNNIYLACNDRNIKKLCFQMTHKRVQK